MALQAVSGSTDLSTKGRRINAILLINTGAAGQLNFRSGSSGGTILFSIPMAATTGSVALSFSKPLIFPAGVYVEVTAGTMSGAVDID